MKRIKVEYVFLVVLLVITMSIPILVLYATLQERSRANAPVDVLRNWTIRVDNSREYAPGEAVSVTSSFQKLITITGQSTRYIQCVKPQMITEVDSKIAANPNYAIPESYWDGRIPINVNVGGQPVTPKNAKGVSNYSLGIPLTVTNLPNYCRVYVNIVYNVNKYHPTFTESSYSNYFRVVPRTGTSALPQTIIYTDNPSLFQPTPDTYTNSQPSTSQPPVIIYQTPPNAEEESAQSTEERSDPSLLDRVQNVLNSVLNVISL